MSLPDLAFIDVETLGLDAEKHRVIEVAVCRVPFNVKQWPAEPEIVVRRFTPSEQDYGAAQAGALNVNGYHPGHPDWKTAEENPAAAWIHLHRNYLFNAALVSQNVPFDRGFINAELRRYGEVGAGKEGRWARRAIDIQSYSALIAMEKGLSKWGLHDVYNALALPALQEHRAEADVRRGMAVFKYVYDRVIRTS
jgi:DNA polymerase III epsilon subunit-like protein